jgi:hypothetical protein
MKVNKIEAEIKFNELQLYRDIIKFIASQKDVELSIDLNNCVALDFDGAFEVWDLNKYISVNDKIIYDLYNK